MLTNCLDGGYINFAICTYYNDDSYGQFLLQLCTCILCVPQVSVLSYKKSSEKIVKLLCELIRKQLSMLMLTVDTDTISKLFTNVLLPALRET